MSLLFTLRGTDGRAEFSYNSSDDGQTVEIDRQTDASVVQTCSLNCEVTCLCCSFFAELTGEQSSATAQLTMVIEVKFASEQPRTSPRKHKQVVNCSSTSPYRAVIFIW